MSTGFTKALGRIGHMLIRHTKCLNATLAFQSASGGTGYLSVGSVTGIGVITSYIIEWHLGSPYGIVALLSGYNPDVTVNTLHPFTNEPVQSGNLYAVIRYITIDGVRYSPYYRVGQYSPDLKLCFNYIAVSAVTCANGIAGDYSHTFTYVNTIQPAQDASRLIRFVLNGSTNFVAYQFLGFSVVDQIKLSYVSILDPNNPKVCSYWQCGTNSSSNFTSIPKLYSQLYMGGAGILKQVINLRNFYNFNEGDYLLIEVIPRVLQPTVADTNWTLKLKCLATFADYVPPPNCRKLDITSIRAEWDSVSCSASIYYKHINEYIVPSHFLTYLHSYILNFPDTSQRFNTSTNEWKLAGFTNSSNISAYSISSTGSCISTPSIRYVKTGSQLVIIFNSYSNYIVSKNTYNTATSDSNWTNYVNDPTKIEYYKFYNLALHVGTICGGDSVYTIQASIHKSSTISFDDVNYTITMNVPSISNQYVFSGSGCINNTYIAAYCGYNNNFIALADFDISSNIQYTSIIGFVFLKVNSSSIITSSRIIEGKYHDTAFNVFCEMFNPTGWTSYNNTYYAQPKWGYVIGDRLFSITDINNPTNNFRIESYQNQETGAALTDCILEYTKYNGIVYDGQSNSPTNIISNTGWLALTLTNLARYGSNPYTNSISYVTALLNNFNFNIPLDRVITGISLEFIFFAYGGIDRAYIKVRISTDGGTTWSNSLEVGNKEINSTGVITRIGSPTELWGISLTPAIINSSNFVIEFSGKTMSASYMGTIDYLKVFVYYNF